MPLQEEEERSGGIGNVVGMQGNVEVSIKKTDDASSGAHLNSCAASGLKNI